MLASVRVRSPVHAKTFSSAFHDLDLRMTEKTPTKQSSLRFTAGMDRRTQSAGKTIKKANSEQKFAQLACKSCIAFVASTSCLRRYAPQPAYHCYQAKHTRPHYTRFAPTTPQQSHEFVKCLSTWRLISSEG